MTYNFSPPPAPAPKAARTRRVFAAFFEGTMSGPPGSVAGWYQDSDSGGTKYWDGSRWSGDTRPRRRVFAAPAAQRMAGVIVVIVGVLFLAVSPFSKGSTDGTTSAVESIFTGLIVGLVLVAAGVYLLRGQGPTTSAVADRAAEKRAAADAAERRVAYLRQPAGTVNTETDAEAAQVNAIADPETSRALQNLQNLLYTRAITDKEYQAAKDKLLGASTFANLSDLSDLAQLHETGVLSDYEYAAAKARLLGI